MNPFYLANKCWVNAFFILINWGNGPCGDEGASAERMFVVLVSRLALVCSLIHEP